MKKIDGSHYDVQLTQQEHDLVRLWIESSAVFAGTYAVHHRLENAVAQPVDTIRLTLGNPVGPVVEKRCLTCHGSLAHLGRRVTKEDVLRVAKKHLQPDKVQILAVGRPQDFGEPMSALGPVNEIDITIPTPQQ